MKLFTRWHVMGEVIHSIHLLKTLSKSKKYLSELPVICQMSKSQKMAPTTLRPYHPLAPNHPINPHHSASPRTGELTLSPMLSLAHILPLKLTEIMWHRWEFSHFRVWGLFARCLGNNSELSWILILYNGWYYVPKWQPFLLQKCWAINPKLEMW